jgi:hypothetical protein
MAYNISNRKMLHLSENWADTLPGRGEALLRGTCSYIHRWDG